MSQGSVGSEVLRYNQGLAGDAAEEEFSGSQEHPGDLERIKQNALAQERVFRIQEKLDEIRSDRAKELVARDTDQTTGQVRNGLFGWRAVRRSIERTLGDIVKSSSDYRAAEESVDESGVSSEHIETMMSEAADGFGSLSDEHARQEMSDLLSVIAERYKLDQDTRDTNPVVSKIRTIVGSNSVAINMAIGAAFRIIFKGATHATGLGGAVVTSAIYGGVSKGIGEYRSARSELLGNEGWCEALGQVEHTKQKLELMRQMVSNPETLRKYFAGNSSEAFEFFSQYQELLAQSAQEDQDSQLMIISPSIEGIYSARRKEIVNRAWKAAGKGALRAAVFSAVGYGITHFVSEFSHGNVAHATEEGSDPTAQGESGAAVPTTRVEDAPQAGSEDVVWRWNGIPNQPRLTIDHDTHLFEAGNDNHPQFAEVKIQGSTETGDTGSTPEEVAKVIAKSIGGKGGVGHFEVTDEQRDEIQKHITEWLKENRASEIQDGEFATGTTVRVDASELNDALKNAGIDKIELVEAEAGPDTPSTPESGGSAGPEDVPADADGSAPGSVGTPVGSPAPAEQPDSGTGEAALPPGTAEATDIPSDNDPNRPDGVGGTGRPPAPETGADEASPFPAADSPEKTDSYRTMKIVGGVAGLAVLSVVAVLKRREIAQSSRNIGRKVSGSYSELKERVSKLFSPPATEATVERLIERKDYQKAYQAAKQLPDSETKEGLTISAGTSYLEQMLKMARTKKNDELFTNAQKLALELLGIDSKNDYFLAAAAECELNLNEPQTALEHLQAISNPEIFDKLLLVETMMRLDQLDEAFDKAENIIRSTEIGSQGNAKAHWYTAIILHKRNASIDRIRTHAEMARKFYADDPSEEWQEILRQIDGGS